MANILIQPYINPARFVKLTPIQIPQYVSKFLDDWLASEIIHDYEQRKCYVQKWLNDDSIRLQFISNYGPLTLRLMDRQGVEIYSTPFETRQQDFFRPGYYIRQIELDLAPFEPGYCYLKIDAAGLDPWVSEPFEIVETFANSLYVEYSHPDYYQGVYFNSPFSPAIRIPAVLDYSKPGMKSTIYEDQNLNETMVKAVPFRLWTLTLGDAHGIPPFLIDKIDRIFGCPDLQIDGRFFTKNEGAEWDKSTIDLYPFAGWNIELREKLNRATVQYEDDVVISGENNMMAVIDTKGFGVNDNGGDFLEILDVN